MVDYDHEFWLNGDDDKQLLARRFEQGIEIESPPTASCFCSDHCPWAATKVTYYNYDGPALF